MTSKSNDTDLAADPLWIAFSRTENLDELITDFRGFAHRLGFHDPQEVQRIISAAMEEQPLDSLRQLFAENHRFTAPAKELISAFIIRGIDYRGISADLTRQAHDYLMPLLRSDSPLHAYAMHHQCQRWIWEGQPVKSLKILDNFETHGRKPDNEVLKIWADSLIGATRGFAQMEIGDFRGATELLQKSLTASRGLDFVLQGNAEFLMASMFRESYQPAKALEIWYEPQRMQKLHQRKEWPRIVASHLNACRCAVDLSDIPGATTALENAERYMPKVQELYPRLLGYRHLRRGEVCTLEEDYARGETMLVSAIDYFESIDPPCREGWLESRIALGQYALLQNNLPLAWAIIKKLISEADALGHLGLRSRALLMQTWFFVSETPPAEEAFEQTLDQLQKIHNPAQLFHAFSHLLNFCVEHLDEKEATTIREQMASLRDRLTDENYLQLLDRYVPERLRDKELN